MKINNFGYLIKEGVKSVFIHGIQSFGAIIVTVASLLLVGIFASVMYNLNIMVEDLNQTNEILVYIDETLPDAEAESIETYIRAMDNIYSAEFVHRDQALEDFLAQHGGDPVFSGMDASTLRHRIVVVLEDNDLMKDTVDDLYKINGVAEISAHYELAEGFTMVQDMLEVVFMLVLVVLLAVSLLIIGSTVNIAMLGRQDEIAIMKMVGATKGFIRLPFVVQGFLLGMVGAGLAFATLWWLYDTMLEKLAVMDTLNMFHFVPFRQLMLPMIFIFAGAGMFVGIVGGWSSIQRFLNK